VLGGLTGLWLMPRSQVWRVGAWVLAVAGPVLVTLAALPFRAPAVLAVFLFGTLLLVIAVAVIGGMRPGLTAVVVGIVARATLLTRPAKTPGGNPQASLLSLAVFTVTSVRTYAKDQFPTAAVYGPVPDAELRLITCGGVFDRSTGSYLSNVVVFARMTG